MLILLFKNVLNISNFENETKTSKNLKKKGKKTSFFLCVCTFTWEEKVSIIKIAYLMLIFLNLKSLLSYLFFVVASSLSMVCDTKSLRKILNRLMYISVMCMKPHILLKRGLQCSGCIINCYFVSRNR